MIDALCLGFIPNDITFDNTPIFNTVLESTVTDLYFSAGDYYFNTQPNIINKPFSIRGNGINITSLIRNFSTNDLYSALLHTKCSFIAENFGIIATPETHGGGGIKIETIRGSSSVLRDLYITGGYNATFDIPICLYALEEMGIRDCLIDNVDLFSATEHLAWFVNVKGLTCNLNAYPAGGIVDHVTIQGSETRSSNILITTHYLQTLYLYNVDNIAVLGIGNTTINQTNCNNVRLI